MDLIKLSKSIQDLEALTAFISSLGEEKKYWEFPFDIGIGKRIDPTAENIWIANGNLYVTVILAKEADKILGFCFMIRNIQYPQIPSLSIVVKQENQGKGIGQSLIGELKRRVKEENLKGIYCGCLEENTRALDFYSKLDFQKKSVKFKDGRPVIELTWWNPNYKGDLMVVCSITDQSCFDRCIGESLKKLGCGYTLVITDPDLSLSESYNSILKIHLEAVKNSKYLLFVGQDIIIEGKDWGKRLVASCDSLSDFGYGGVECMDERGWVGCHADSNNPIQQANCCDAGLIIIPSKIFLEHQFDTQFDWYPVAEDYACWVKIERHLEVYHIPIDGYNADARNCPQSKFYKEHPPAIRHRKMNEDHTKLLRKWKLDKLKTTSKPMG